MRRLIALLSLALLVAVALSPIAGARQNSLDQVVERLELTDVPLTDALRLLSEETGVNLVASPSAGAMPVSTFLMNLTVRQAIETLAKSNGLWFREDPESGVVRLMTGEEFERDLILFKDEETRVFTLLYPNAVDIALAIRNLFGDRVRLSLDQSQRYEDFEELSQRFQKFDLLEQRAQSLGIFGGGGQNTVGQNGFNNSSGGSAFTRSNSPGFNQSLQSQTNQAPSRAPEPGGQRETLTPAQMEAVQAANTEAAIDAILGDHPSIFVTLVRRTNMIAVRSSDRTVIDEIERLITALDVPTPQVLLEMKILSLDLGEDFDSVFDFSYAGSNLSTSFARAAADPTRFIHQYVNDEFLARIELLESRDRVTTLATPLLLVANNEVARLFVGEERPIVRNVSSQTTVNESTGFISTSPTIEVRPVGTTLLLTPNINADRTVTMRIIQETSTVKEDDAEIPVQTDNSGTLTPFPVDVVQSRTMNATVVGQDGLTVALGGLIEEGVTKMRSGVPGLMDIPYLGVLFRRDHDVRSRSELVVMIKPMVLFTTSEGVARTEDLMSRLSHHPSAATLGEKQLETFAPHEVPRGTPDVDPLKDALRFQTGRPADGGTRR